VALEGFAPFFVAVKAPGPIELLLVAFSAALGVGPAVVAAGIPVVPAVVAAAAGTHTVAEMPMKDGVAVADAVMQLVELHVEQPELGLVEPLVLSRAQGVAVVHCQN
jgi:hypothetical protein